MTILHSLRKALVANALFSTICALILLISPGTVGGIVGYDNSLLYTILGIGLLLFAADLCHQATRPALSRFRAILASFGDISWVFATAVLLLFFRDKVSATGVVILLCVAISVLFFGLLQARAINKELG